MWEELAGGVVQIVLGKGELSFFVKKTCNTPSLSSSVRGQKAIPAQALPHGWCWLLKACSARWGLREEVKILKFVWAEAQEKAAVMREIRSR